MIFFTPAIIEAFTQPIAVPATMSIFILFFTRALKTPYAKVHRDPSFEVLEHFQFHLISY